MRIHLQVISTALLLLGVGCTKQSDDTWNVISLGLPPEVRPKFSHSLSTAYILKQTHEPLFRYDERKGYYSRVLERWTRSVDSKSFSFCIDRPKPFGDRTEFGAEELNAFLTEKLKSLAIEPSSKTFSNSCVEMTFSQPQKRILYDLSQLENSPTKPSQFPKIENGLGAFVVSQSKIDELHLTRKVPSKTGYNTIVFTNVDQLEVSQIEKLDAEDYNLLPVHRIPSEIKNRYKAYKTMPLRIGALVLNVEDARIRKAIATCVDIDSLRNGIFTQGTQFSDIATILPVGVPGAKSGRLNRKCSPASSAKLINKPLRFASWKGSHQPALEEELASLSRKAAVAVKPEFYSYSDLTHLIYNKKDKYEALVIKVDTKTKATSPFFEAFVDTKKTILKFPLPELDKELRRLRKAEAEGESTDAAERIQSALIDQNYIVPLFQETRSLYYPNDLDDIHLDDDYLDFPDLSRITRAGL